MAETIDLFAAKEVGATLPWAVLAIKVGMLSGAGHGRGIRGARRRNEYGKGRREMTAPVAGLVEIYKPAHVSENQHAEY
jgi:hypothetical protein